MYASIEASSADPYQTALIQQSDLDLHCLSNFGGGGGGGASKTFQQALICDLSFKN